MDREDFSEQKGDAKWKGLYIPQVGTQPTVHRLHDFESPIEIITTKNITGRQHHRQPSWLHRSLLAPCVTQTLH
jgi:hypothetical protein